MTNNMGSEVYRILWEFVAFGSCMGWLCHMAGWGSSGKRVTGLLKG